MERTSNLLGGTESCSATLLKEQRRCIANWRLTFPSSGRPPASFACFRPPLTSNVSRHMYQCPTCHESTISGWQKWGAHTTHPARCSSCSSLSFVPTVTSSGILSASVALIAFVGIFIGVPLHSPTPVLLAIIGALFFYIWRWHVAVLLPTNSELVASARRSNRLLNLLVLLGILAE